MSKLYIYFAVLIIVVGFIKWYSSNQFDAGYNKHKAEVADIKDAADVKNKIKVDEVIKWRTKTKVVYRDKVKIIRASKDSTGCADTKLTNMGFSLFKPGSSDKEARKRVDVTNGKTEP